MTTTHTTKANKLTPREQLKKATAAAKRERLVAKMELALRAHQLPAWMREVEFHANRGWRLDIAWVSNGWAPVAIEVHGDVWPRVVDGKLKAGRHVRGQGFIDDRCKMNEAQLLGWTVIEVTEAHIDSGQAIEWVKRALGVT